MIRPGTGTPPNAAGQSTAVLIEAPGCQTVTAAGSAAKTLFGLRPALLVPLIVACALFMEQVDSTVIRSAYSAFRSSPDAGAEMAGRAASGSGE